VLRCLREKRRRVNIQTKAKKQSYFRNVFREATDVNSDIDSGENENDAADDVDRPPGIEEEYIGGGQKQRSF